MSRTLERSAWPAEVRQAQLETDVDTIERDLMHLTDSVDTRLGKIMWTLVGLLVSVSTAAVLLAINLAAKP